MRKVSWGEYQSMVEHLAKRIQPTIEDGKIDSLYGIPRGGLVVAVSLSHQLQIPLRDSIDDKTLVVDDIVDSGATLDLMLAKFPFEYMASLFYKDKKPQFYVAKKVEDWIMFPWEIKETTQ